MTEATQYDQLLYYTFAHPDRELFIHQFAVDAYTAQHANEATKPIAITYALISLYLGLEKGWTGKQAQDEHIRLSRNKTNLPSIRIPHHKGEIKIEHVLSQPEGALRDAKIMEWCASIWEAYAASRQHIIDYLTHWKP